MPNLTRKFYREDETTFNNSMQEKSQVHTAFPIRTLRICLSSFEWIRHHVCHNNNLHYAPGVCATNIKYTR